MPASIEVNQSRKLVRALGRRPLPRLETHGPRRPQQGRARGEPHQAAWLQQLSRSQAEATTAQQCSSRAATQSPTPLAVTAQGMAICPLATPLRALRHAGRRHARHPGPDRPHPAPQRPGRAGRAQSPDAAIDPAAVQPRAARAAAAPRSLNLSVRRPGWWWWGLQCDAGQPDWAAAERGRGWKMKVGPTGCALTPPP